MSTLITLFTWFVVLHHQLHLGIQLQELQTASQVLQGVLVPMRVGVLELLLEVHYFLVLVLMGWVAVGDPVCLDLDPQSLIRCNNS